jgi:ABC-type multidrug transport system fused ATPase/permease subunit
LNSTSNDEEAKSRVDGSAPSTVGKEDTTESRASTDYRFLLAMVHPYRIALFGALCLMSMQSLASLTNPWLAGQFSNAMLNESPVAKWLVAWFAVVLVQSALTYAVAMRLEIITARLVADASTRAFDHLQSLPLQWHQSRRRGDVLSLLNQDVGRLGSFVTNAVAPALPLLLTCAGALVMMLRIQPWFALGAVALTAAIAIGMRIVGRKLRPLGTAAIQAYATRSAIAEQNLVMLPIVKAFTGESRELDEFSRQVHSLRDIEIAGTRMQAMVGPVVRVVTAAAVLAMLWFASGVVSEGVMTAGDLISLLLYGLLLTQPMSALAGLYGQVQTARGTAQRLIGLFKEMPEPDDGGQDPLDPRGEIVFEQVKFAYPGREPVLQRCDLHLKPGESVAITGANGAGKSTLAHLLLRFSDPSAGRILLDGHDLREFNLRSLREQFGLVSQNILLFNASVLDNIAYGHPLARREEIEAAARAARAHDFVAMLPRGYDTLVGDQGIRLSGGQKQRIALARALLKDPVVLILDEATAMFDPAGEDEFISECQEMLRNRTVLLITHRPASLALADRVLRLENGRLTEVL